MKSSLCKTSVTLRAPKGNGNARSGDARGWRAHEATRRDARKRAAMVINHVQGHACKCQRQRPLSPGRCCRCISSRCGVVDHQRQRERKRKSTIYTNRFAITLNALSFALEDYNCARGSFTDPPRWHYGQARR